jgi:hypothetical protein
LAVDHRAKGMMCHFYFLSLLDISNRVSKDFQENGVTSHSLSNCVMLANINSYFSTMLTLLSTASKELNKFEKAYNIFLPHFLVS